MYKDDTIKFTGITKDDVFEQLIQEIKNVSYFAEESVNCEDIEAIRNNKCLVDIGINSIDYVDIVDRLLSAYDLIIPIDRFVNVNKIQDVVDIVYQEINRKSVQPIMQGRTVSA